MPTIETFDPKSLDHYELLKKLLIEAKVLPANRALAVACKEAAVNIPIKELPQFVSGFVAHYMKKDDTRGPTIRQGIQKRGWMLTVYGMPGVGKTTWASEAPRALIADIEDGCARIDCSSLPVATWQGFLTTVKWFVEQQSDYQTLVIDTADVLEKLLWSDICAEMKWKSIETPGFGRGYAEALERWTRALSAMRAGTKAGKNFIFTAHSQVKTVLNPEGESYDRNNIALNKNVSEYFFGQMDAVLFAHYDTQVYKNKSDRQVANTTGERLLTVGESLSCQVKNRFGLSGKIPMDSSVFALFDGTM